MARALGNLLEAATFFGALANEMKGYRAELDRAAQIIEDKAKSLPGNEQSEWPGLAESTLADKERGGWPTPSPLKRSGEMAASYEHETGETSAIVGSKDPIAKYQEDGTSRIPPRPVVGLAILQTKDQVEREVGDITIKRLLK